MRQIPQRYAKRPLGCGFGPKAERSPTGTVQRSKALSPDREGIGSRVFSECGVTTARQLSSYIRWMPLGQIMNKDNEKACLPPSPYGRDHAEGISPSDEALLYAIAASSRSTSRRRASIQTGAVEALQTDVTYTGALEPTVEELLRKAVENRASGAEMSDVFKLLHSN